MYLGQFLNSLTLLHANECDVNEFFLVRAHMLIQKNNEIDGIISWRKAAVTRVKIDEESFVIPLLSCGNIIIAYKYRIADNETNETIEAYPKNVKLVTVKKDFTGEFEFANLDPSLKEWNSPEGVVVNSALTKAYGVGLKFEFDQALPHAHIRAHAKYIGILNDEKLEELRNNYGNIVYGNHVYRDGWVENDEQFVDKEENVTGGLFEVIYKENL